MKLKDMSLQGLFVLRSFSCVSVEYIVYMFCDFLELDISIKYLVI